MPKFVLKSLFATLFGTKRANPRPTTPIGDGTTSAVSVDTPPYIDTMAYQTAVLNPALDLLALDPSVQRILAAVVHNAQAVAAPPSATFASTSIGLISASTVGVYRMKSSLYNASFPWPVDGNYHLWRRLAAPGRLFTHFPPQDTAHCDKYAWMDDIDDVNAPQSPRATHPSVIITTPSSSSSYCSTVPQFSSCSEQVDPDSGVDVHCAGPMKAPCRGSLGAAHPNVAFLKPPPSGLDGASDGSSGGESSGPSTGAALQDPVDLPTPAKDLQPLPEWLQRPELLGPDWVLEPTDQSAAFVAPQLTVPVFGLESSEDSKVLVGSAQLSPIIIPPLPVGWDVGPGPHTFAFPSYSGLDEDEDIGSPNEPSPVVSPFQPAFAHSSTVLRHGGVEYTVHGKLGEGNFGRVYYAHTQYGLEVALKTFHKPKIAFEDRKSEDAGYAADALNWIFHEHHVLRQVTDSQHKRSQDKNPASPFLTQLLASFQDENNIYFVMRMYPEDFRKLLLARLKMPLEDIRYYAAQIVLGIEQMHQIGVMHRDLKPENVLVSPNGHLSICDFGLSKVFPSSPGFYNRRTFGWCGTQVYHAPELCVSEKELNRTGYTAAVDVWAFGIILLEMFIGEGKPFFDHRKQVDMTQSVYLLEILEHVDNLDARDLLLSILLPTNPKSRPTIYEVKKHAFFPHSQWNIIQQRLRPASYRPRFYGPQTSEVSLAYSSFHRTNPGFGTVEVPDEALSYDYKGDWEDDASEHGKCVWNPAVRPPDEG